MKWNVYHYNVNHQKIEVFNIFEHGSFVKYIKEAIEECEEKNSFAERLKSELRYFFWGKVECEIIISPWCGNKNPDEIKIDVFDQVMNNFDIFVDYVWENREELMKDYD